MWPLLDSAFPEQIVWATLDSTPWYDTQLFGAVIGATIPLTAAVVSARRKAAKERALEKANTEIAMLKGVADKYAGVKARLEKSMVVVDYDQPVLLLGPRQVGKSSLMMQWHAPWNRDDLPPTERHTGHLVPVYEFEEPKGRPHFADPDVRTAVRAHLRLLVHDFPGEEDWQDVILRTARSETQRLRQGINLYDRVSRDLGVVVVCMFDAKELAGEIGAETREYYGGDLFRRLHALNSDSTISVERLIVVFNKFDQLRDELSGSDDELLKRCSDTLHKEFGGILGVCSHERTCHAISILGRERPNAVQGASFIRGEAVRSLVTAVAGADVARETIGPEPPPPGIPSSLPYAR